MATVDYDVTRESLIERAREIRMLAKKRKLNPKHLVDFSLTTVREMGLPKSHRRLQKLLANYPFANDNKKSANGNDRIAKLVQRYANQPDKTATDRLLKELVKVYSVQPKGVKGKTVPFKFASGKMGTVIEFDKEYYRVKGEGKGRPRKIHKDNVRKLKNMLAEKRAA